MGPDHRHNMPAAPAGGNPHPYRFRVSLAWESAQLLLITGGGFGLMAAVAIASDLAPPLDRGAIQTGLTVVIATAIGLTGGLTQWKAVRVGPAGIASETTVGPPVVTDWDDMISVRASQVLLMPQLVVRRQSCWPRLVLPLRLADPAGFLLAVERFAGGDHPLTCALDGEPEDGE